MISTADLCGDEPRCFCSGADDRSRGRPPHEVEDYSGIGFQSRGWQLPVVVPFELTRHAFDGWFYGKVMVFRARVDQGYVVLVVIGVLNTAVSVTTICD